MKKDLQNKVIGVVMGGPSTERAVSLRTGMAIVMSLKSLGYQVESIDLDPVNFLKQLKDKNIDIVFNAVHGLYGEDGKMQGFLDMVGIPYTGSGVTASAIAMDKVASKRIFVAENIPTPDFLVITKDNLAQAEEIILEKFSLPIVIKPKDQGSSFGVAIIDNLAELKTALVDSLQYSSEVLIERFITGRELTVSTLYEDGEIKVFPIIEIAPKSGKYDYQSKYTVGATEYIVPAQIDCELTKKIQAVAKRVFEVIGGRGVARTDVILDNDNNFWVLEINTVPGMTETSLVPKAAKSVGISFEQLCEKILHS